VLQTCASGQLDWADIPAQGTSTRGMKTPAVLLEVLPGGSASAHAH
jgi:periplasmic copper chaperone A